MSKEVKRYESVRIAEDPSGRFVSWEDYDALLAEWDALKKDAERYRWLRLQASRTHTEIGEVPSQYRDQFIDAALQGE